MADVGLVVIISSLEQDVASNAKHITNRDTVITFFIIIYLGVNNDHKHIN